jgi:hypothetical protein
MVCFFTPRPLYPQGKSPWYLLDRGLGELNSRSGRGGEEKKFSAPAGYRILEPRSSSPWPIRYTDWAITAPVYITPWISGLPETTVFTKARRWSVCWGRMNSVHNSQPSFFVSSNNILPSTRRPFKSSVPFRFPYQNSVYTSPLRVTCPVHLILCLTTLICEAYKSWWASFPMGPRDSFPGGKAAGAWSWSLTSI